MEKKISWKRTIAGIILIAVIVWFGTAIIISDIMNLSVAVIATVITFASVITYLVSKLL